ncbi:MAG: AAA family ATPase [Methanopyri archaeon]|nr:AAA family ATPase [Methanopyri archaeon]
MYVGIDGVDGVGKTSVVHTAAEILEMMGYDVATVAEPYTEIGKRALELEDPYAQALAFTLDRMLLHTELNLKEHDLVISDRTLLSTIAYQSTLGADFDWLVELQRPVPKPDVIFIIDREPMVEDEEFDREFLKKVRRMYRKAADAVETRYSVEVKWLKAEGKDVEDIANVIVSYIRKRIDDPLKGVEVP